MVLMRTVDLFCGAGGLSTGFEKEGFRIIAGVDKKEVFLKTYDYNNSNYTMAIEENLMNTPPEELLDRYALDKDKIDVVIGGPPCKGFSIAGKRDPEDKRNNLVDKFIDYVDYIKPKIFVMENVPGILSMKDGKVIDIIMKRFRNIGHKTCATYKVLNSADYGVPQTRERVIFIGRLDGKSIVYPNKTHTQNPNKNEELEPYVTVKDAIVDKDFSNLPNHEKTNHSESIIERMKELTPGESLYDSYSESWKRLKLDEPAPTIKESHNAPFVHPTKNRVGTVRECAVLQSFADDFVFKGPKSQQLKMVGNAVPPLLAQHIAKSVKNMLNEYTLVV